MNHSHPSTKELKKFKMRTGHSILDKKYLQQIVIAWKPEEIDAIVIVADADDILPEREKKLELALKTIRSNHLDIYEKPINDKSIGGLAIRNFETWLLADRETIENILKVNIRELNDLETLENTKNILEEAIEKSNYLTEEKNAQRPFQIRWNLVHQINLEKIKEYCPQGYGKFILSLGKVAHIFQPK